MNMIDVNAEKSIIERVLGKILNKKSSTQEGSFVVYKDKNGENRWFGTVTNKFMDREGDILTDAAHVEFFEFLNENPSYAPELWVWHTPGTAKQHKADWWEYADGFFMYSGVLTDKEAEQYNEVTDEPIGMSHGFFVIEKIGRFITKYRTFEVSELPLNKAANPFTSFQIKEENNMFSVTKRQFLVERLGEETVSKLEADTEGRAKMLEESGVDWKELQTEYEKEIEAKLADKIQKAAEPTVARIVKEVVEALNIDGLQETLVKMNSGIAENAKLVETVKALQAKVDHLLQTEDERVAKSMTPAQPFDWNLSATKSTDNIVEDEELPADTIEAKKEFSWLDELGPIGGNK